MPIKLTSISQIADLSFDEVIDVRSPAEFAQDHIPGAINLPALDNDERAHVGRIYVQESPFLARKIGAALVARNAARHLEGVLADRPRGYRPLVYCWRGGQRSGALALILRQVGWQADTIDGGYRAYRRLVKQALYNTPWPGQIVLLDGYTGTAKTALLHLLAQAGEQVLDLEALANHRGSLFGGMAGPQPAQKGFETALAGATCTLDHSRPLFAEAESSKIGNINLPPSLWQAMLSAPRVVIDAPIAARAQFLARIYGDITEDAGRLGDTIRALSELHSKDTIARWLTLADAQEWQDLAADLMQQHYDPRYARQRARHDHSQLETLALPDLEPTTLAAAVPRIVQAAEAALVSSG